mgnify:CR=1 FL=1
MDYKLKLRQNSSAKLHHNVVETVFSTIEKAKEFPFATCLTCISFIEKDSYCKQHKCVPPPRVIVYSCPDYFDNDEIPF